jgi:hypothetical protein
MFAHRYYLLFSLVAICLSAATLVIDPTVTQLEAQNFYNISGLPTP